MNINEAKKNKIKVATIESKLRIKSDKETKSLQQPNRFKIEHEVIRKTQPIQQHN